MTVPILLTRFTLGLYFSKFTLSWNSKASELKVDFKGGNVFPADE